MTVSSRQRVNDLAGECLVVDDDRLFVGLQDHVNRSMRHRSVLETMADREFVTGEPSGGRVQISVGSIDANWPSRPFSSLPSMAANTSRSRARGQLTYSRRSTGSFDSPNPTFDLRVPVHGQYEIMCHLDAMPPELSRPAERMGWVVK